LLKSRSILLVLANTSFANALTDLSDFKLTDKYSTFFVDIPALSIASKDLSPGQMSPNQI